MNYNKILAKYRKDRTRLIEILKEIQAVEGYITDRAILSVADGLGLSRAEVEGVVSFYHFLSARPLGNMMVHLNNSITAEMAGREEVATAFERETGCHFGQTSPDGLVTLLDTSCIGMNDQEPAAIINGVVFTCLDQEKVKKLVLWMREGKAARDMVEETGDGANNHELVRAMVRNNIRKQARLFLTITQPGRP